MNTILPILNAHLLSARNALRYDTRMRIAWSIAFILDLALASWSIPQLIARVTQWQVQGPQVIASQIWLLYLLSWDGISFFTVIATLQHGFSNDESKLLITLPISAATRFRALYGLTVFEGIGNWLLLQIIVFGVALFIPLGLHALVWLTLLLLGTAIIAWCSVVATLLFLRYILPNGKRAFNIALLLSLILVLLGLLAHLFGFTSNSLWLPPVSILSHPELLSLLFALFLICAIGPLAHPIGKLYLAAFHGMEGRSGRHTALHLPGVTTLSTLLSRYRNLTSAFIVKELHNQTRYFIGWWRFIVVLLALALFPLARQLPITHSISHLSLVIFYSSGVAILPILEYAPYTLSCEGNRLALYLTAPLSLREILRARITSFLCVVLFIALISSLILSVFVGLSPLELILALSIVALILSGYTAFVVFGSIWGEDINVSVEGFTQAFLQEELPVTPQRIWLLSLSFLLLGIMALLVLQLPSILAFITLLLLDTIIIVLVGHCSLSYLQRLLRAG